VLALHGEKRALARGVLEGTKTAGKLSAAERVSLIRAGALGADRTSGLLRGVRRTSDRPVEKCDGSSYRSWMSIITMSAKGQFVLPKAVRERLKLVPGSKVNVTIDEKNRLVLTPALLEPEALFADRPTAKKIVSVDEMSRTIGEAVRGRL